MLYLARQPRSRVVLISEIAAAQAVPESYLAKIFQDLSKAGLVRSHRGARGGFTLAHSPHEITLRQIVEAVGGPVVLNRCLDPREGCERSADCPVHAALATAQQSLLSALDAVTLNRLASPQTPISEGQRRP
jgi:Rrf2 family protein